MLLKLILILDELSRVEPPVEVLAISGLVATLVLVVALV
jgi:hypothetical protein